MTCFAAFTFKRIHNSLLCVCVGVHEVKTLSGCAGCTETGILCCWRAIKTTRCSGTRRTHRREGFIQQEV